MKKLSHIICFNCCAIYKAKKSLKIKCPECGYSPNRDMYSKIMNYGIAAAYYGHDYREKYEKQINKKGGIKTVYALPEPATILCFLAVAALSGVVGGISYDIVKSVFLKIIGNANKIKKNIGQNKIKFKNDNSIKVFINQMNTFYLDLKDIDPLVKSEIEKEMIIWDFCDAIHPELFNGKYTKEEILEAIKKALIEKEHTQKPSEEDFVDFWKEIE